MNLNYHRAFSNLQTKEATKGFKFSENTKHGKSTGARSRTKAQFWYKESNRVRDPVEVPDPIIISHDLIFLHTLQEEG